MLIHGATLIDGDGARDGALRLEEGRIAEVLPAGLSDDEAAAIAERHGCSVVDGRGRWLIPGGVDPHVHFCLPGGGTRTVDDFVTGGRAALAGGTTTIIDFITPPRGGSLIAATEARLEEAAACPCDYGLHMSLTEWRDGSATELRACAERFGLRSLKLYMAYLESIGLEDDDLASALRAAADLDLTVLVHCEDGVEISRRRAALMAAGDRGPAAHARSRPPELEVRTVERVLELAGQTGCRLYVVHGSTAGTVAAVVAARDRGVDVRLETCPQYLLLDDGEYDRDFDRAAACIMSPPLRPREHVEAMRNAVIDGTVDVVATDHCAFSREQKARGRDDFTRIPGGAAGVEHRLALLHDRGGIAPERWVDLVSTAPARIFGLHPRKGCLAPGADADLVLWDPDAEWTISSKSDHQVCDHGIYEGLSGRGGVDRIYMGGKEISDVDSAGPGRFMSSAV